LLHAKSAPRENNKKISRFGIDSITLNAKQNPIL
jgi:hypothetical protein